MNQATDQQMNIRDTGGCEADQSACWKDKFIEGGLDNTFTSFKHTGQNYTVTFSNDDVDTFSVAGATSWSDQVQQMADGLGSIMPWAVDVDSFCNIMPNGCGGLQAPVVVLNQMIARYVGFRVCPADKVPVSITYTSDQVSEPKQLVVQYVETPTIWLDRCFNCGDSETFFKRGTSEVYEPICAVPCSHIYPNVPLSACDSSFQSGCDNLNTEDQADNVAITAVYQDCGKGIEISYMIDDGDGGLEPYTLVGQFVDCDTGEVVPDPESDCILTLCDFAYDCPSCGDSVTDSITYTNSDEETELVVSVGGNGDIKIDSANGDGSDAEITKYITDCLAAGNEVEISWTGISGGSGSATLLPNVTTNPFPNFYNDSVNATGDTDKLKTLVAKCGGAESIETHKCLRVHDACLLAAIEANTAAIESKTNTHVIEGCIAVDGELVSAYTIMDDSGEALFPPRPLSDLGFNPDCCEIAKEKEVK